MCDELLAIEQLDTLLAARVLVANWRTEYNAYRPPLRARHALAHSSRVDRSAESGQLRMDLQADDL
jgi:hypothetical protein